MENIVLLGNTIKAKRLSKNMTMSELAKRANISRATLSAIENGQGNYSVNTLFRLLDILDLCFVADNRYVETPTRKRASRINSITDKRINRFIVMCIEQYAFSINKSGQDVYKNMLCAGVINELRDDYEDLHGMSMQYLNDYISSMLGDGK